MNAFKQLKTRLRELAELREHKVNSGNVPDFAVYKQLTGERTGLLLALREAEDLQHKVDEDDE